MDGPKFEIEDGVVVCPILAPFPGYCAKEKEDAERAAAWAYYLNGGGGDPSYFDGYSLVRQR